MNTTRTLCFVIAALSSYAAFAFRLCQGRRNWKDSAYRTLMTTLLLQCLTFTMGAVAMQSASFLGVGNLAILTMHLAAVGFCISAQVILLRWAAAGAEAARQTRLWVATGIALSVLLTVLFFLADGTERAPLDFDGSGDPLLLTYLLVFIASQAVPCVTIVLQCGPYVRMTDNASLRRALRMLSVAAWLLLLYSLVRVANVLSIAAGLGIGEWKEAVASVVNALGIVAVSLSLAMPFWGPSAARLLEWTRTYRSYRALHPLWRDLYESFPDIALEPPGTSVRDLDYRLHRRVVEIRDGWRDLRPYMERSAGRTAGAAGAGSEEFRQARTEAAQIRQALHARRTGTVPRDNKDACDFDDRDSDSFAAEVAWLTKVAAAYRHLGAAEAATGGARGSGPGLPARPHRAGPVCDDTGELDDPRASS
ncbi:MAB_1171c family putative transporter [Streptomyces sp. NPDC058655]|uniref:MAB_1171c family putative transporter n=1 Tax=unclassified Streptomyces TaxID=2593676 RepID=UPI003655F511